MPLLGRSTVLLSWADVVAVFFGTFPVTCSSRFMSIQSKFGEVVVFGTVISGEVEVNRGAGLSKQHHATAESVCIPYLVVNALSFACQVCKQELSRLDLVQNALSHDIF